MYRCIVHRQYCSLHSSVYTEIQGTLIDGGANKQWIATPDGFVIPLHIRNGLANLE
jgi:hypothetical protein